jgi:hypothetical protein
MTAKKPPVLELDCPRSENEWCIDDVVDDDANNLEESIFVNLSENRESFTAYEGNPVWQIIYTENCDCSEGIHLADEETCSE